jgi:hypothetical protein
MGNVGCDAGYWEQKGDKVPLNNKHNDQKAADDFKRAADCAREAGEFENAARDDAKAANALFAKHDLKGSAENLEAAGADMLKTNRGEVSAKYYYSGAGTERMDAGKAAGRNHKEAAKQYGKAQEDFTKARDAARKIGDTKSADEYGKQADDAGEKAAAEMGEDGKAHMHAGKAAGRNHKEAAKQYGQAEKDFNDAADFARKAGDTKSADEYAKQAHDAGEKAYHARHLQFQQVLNGIAVRHDEKRTVQKAAGVRDASPAHSDPRNKL